MTPFENHTLEMCTVIINVIIAPAEGFVPNVKNKSSAERRKQQQSAAAAPVGFVVQRLKLVAKIRNV